MSTVFRFEPSINTDQTCGCRGRDTNCVKQLTLVEPPDSQPQVKWINRPQGENDRRSDRNPDDAAPVPGIVLQWRSAYRIKKIACCWRISLISGSSGRITACPVPCRAAAPVQFGMTRKDANTRANRRFAVAACIISRQSAAIATA